MSFEQSYLLALGQLLYYGETFINLRPYHGNINKLFSGLTLLPMWHNKVMQVGYMLHQSINPIYNPSTYRFNFPIIRGPAAYFEVVDKDHIKILTISSGYPYMNLHTVSTKY